MIIFYSMFVYNLSRDTLKSLGILTCTERHLRSHNMFGQFEPSIKLKRNMLKVNLMISLTYGFAILSGLLVHTLMPG